MARPPRDPRLSLDQPGQRPILQGHLRRGGRPVSVRPPEPTEPTAPPPADGETAEPANEVAARQRTRTKGKATRSAKVATTPNVGGSEQGPA